MLSSEPGERPLYEITNVTITHLPGGEDTGHIEYVKPCD